MSNRKIIESIQKITGTQLVDNVKLLSASVDSVDESKRTCVVTTISSRGSVTIENVQLMASVDDGFLIIPAVDSTVIVSYSTFNQPFIALFSTIAKVVIVSGLVQFNEGLFGGLVKVDELTTKLNNLENLVNNLVTKYNTHTHVLALSAGTGTAAPTVTTEPGTLTPTQATEIEDQNITH